MAALGYIDALLYRTIFADDLGNNLTPIEILAINLSGGQRGRRNRT
jgi:hypothetical protein